MEDIVTYLKKERNKIISDYLPSLISGAGLTECTTKEGLKIKLEKKLSVTQHNKKAVLDWLVENGYKEFIKDKLELSMGELDKHLQNFLSDNGYSYKQNSEIHYQTLAKIIRDRIKEGEKLPDDSIATINVINIAKIK